MRTKYKNVVGQKFGFLQTKEIIILDLRKNNSKIYGFVCVCDCGNNVKKPCREVISGLITSCGCRRDQYEKISGKNNVRFTGYEEISGSYWAMLKQSAKLRNHEFSISLKYIWDLFVKQNSMCILSNLELSFPKNKRTVSESTYSASLDRIDSTKGYIEGNVQWIHKDINLMKQQYTMEYFCYMCNLIAKNHPQDTSINITTLIKGGRFGKQPKNKD